MELEELISEFYGDTSAFKFSIDQLPVDQIKVTESLRELGQKNFSKTIQSRFLALPAFKGTEKKEMIENFWRSRKTLTSAIQQALDQGAKPENLHCSLSHTGGACIAVTSVQSSIGVDLELTLRPINVQLASRITNSDEKISNLNALQVWVIKEACFKANPNNQGTVLPQYRIIEEKNQRGIVKFQGAGSQDFNFIVTQSSGYTIALAKEFKKTV